MPALVSSMEYNYVYQYVYQINDEGWSKYKNVFTLFF